MGYSIKYKQRRSFVESSFFTKFSELKLNKLKLDSSELSITCFMINPLKLNKFNNTPTINLDYSSFEQTDESSMNSLFKGTLLNVNTIEEFKGINKQNLLHKWGEDIHSKITKDDQFDHSVVNSVYVLIFADLKKYKFYYWVAFPQLQSPWNIIKKTEIKENDEQISTIKNYIKEKGFKEFFQEHDGSIVESKYIVSDKSTFVFIDTCINDENMPSANLANYLYLLAFKGFNSIELIVYRSNFLSFVINLELEKDRFDPTKLPNVIGWERNSNGKLGPKLADLGSLINPTELARQASELNLKLMKWRIAPQLDLDVIKNQRILLLGAGTLGSYVSRALLGWGVTHITFVDSGRVSYSNPVRQPLFQFKDCFSDSGKGALKANRAAEALREIYPGVVSQGFNLEVPMIGHPANENSKSNFDKLCELYEEHDVVFLLMDSRESRWLPTLMGLSMDKIVINAALGFDSYLVMRHGNIGQKERLGCYYCNDVVAPNDSLSDRTLDQMCTVTRPGAAMLASSLAVELLVSILQHPDRQNASIDSTKFGEIPHQIRGFLHNFQQTKLTAPSYINCSACSQGVLDAFAKSGWDFVVKCLNDSHYLEDICGLTEVQKEAEEASQKILDEIEFSNSDEEGWLD